MQSERQDVKPWTQASSISSREDGMIATKECKVCVVQGTPQNANARVRTLGCLALASILDPISFALLGRRRASDLAQPPHPKPVSKNPLITTSLSFFSPARCLFLATGSSSAQKLLPFRCHFPSTSVCHPRKYIWSTIPGSVASPASSRGLS